MTRIKKKKDYEDMTCSSGSFPGENVLRTILKYLTERNQNLKHFTWNTDFGPGSSNWLEDQRRVSLNTTIWKYSQDIIVS